MAKTAVIVPVSPKTGKQVLKPKAGASVYYAVRTARGALKRIPMPYPQAYLKADLAGMNKALKTGAGSGVLTLYEQASKQTVKGEYKMKAGKPVLDSQGRRVPVKKVKLTFRRLAGKQRPVIIKLGRSVKKITQDFAFRKRTKREEVDLKLAQLIPIATRKEKDVYSKEIHLSGKTIFDTIKNIKPDIAFKDFKKHKINAIWVEGLVRIRDGREMIAALKFSSAISALWNFSSIIAKEVRFKLADIGYRFTSLAELQRLEKKMDKAGKPGTVMRIGVSRKHVKDLKPTRRESKDGETLPGGYDVSVSLKITGYRDPTRKPKKSKPAARKPAARKPAAKRKKTTLKKPLKGKARKK